MKIDLGKVTAEELAVQKKLLEERVLEWLSDIPIGGQGVTAKPTPDSKQWAGATLFCCMSY
eukprot:SAG11_NODE_38226_length_253_cov_0.675325_1_plen_60_part_10